MNDKKTKDTSIPIEEMNKLNIKDDKPKQTTEKSGGLKDFLNNNNNNQQPKVIYIKKN